VELTGTVETIELQIVDDGTGFDPRLAGARGGLGLVSMQERLRLVSGALTIHSRPASGTRIVVRVPRSSAGQAEGALPAERARIR
jgi:signal transduction histidine kinase